MRTGIRRAQNFTDFNSPRHQSVGDERAVTAPRDGLGAHDRQRFLARRFDQVYEILSEFIGLHVIGKASERRVTPTRVHRVGPGSAQPAQSRHVAIPNANRFQAHRQILAVELGVVARTRDGPHIDQSPNLVRLQDVNEFPN